MNVRQFYPFPWAKCNPVGFLRYKNVLNFLRFTNCPKTSQTIKIKKSFTLYLKTNILYILAVIWLKYRAAYHTEQFINQSLKPHSSKLCSIHFRMKEIILCQIKVQILFIIEHDGEKIRFYVKIVKRSSLEHRINQNQN